ncbi:hypothetical protein ASF00_09360 [Sphingomonas sp. Leaf34]|uniref:hypothetical protein n=1 Tax=Sphingomonas sp. Leaf34 TaxID=1736216 RepID=UPI0006F72A82|nr:hypothetical protein [Sphingomonas sp. Leaf34]KQN28106.1 hypothetical protein ASF00_09360 [Sphingomonas sp. Leaf34]
MPTQFDTDHAAFVRQEYRRATVVATAVKARNATAREVTLDTNLDQANATRIANNILTDNVKPRAFEVEFEGTLPANAIQGGPPAFILNSRRLANYTVKAFSIVEDYEKNTTTIQVRG